MNGILTAVQNAEFSFEFKRMMSLCGGGDG